MIAPVLAWLLSLQGGLTLFPVAILQLEEGGSRSPSAARLLRSELDLAGFDTSLVTVPPPSDGTEATEARTEGVELLGDMGEGALVDTTVIGEGYVEVAWHPANTGGVRWRRIPLRHRERLTSLALEVAEFLNPLMMESQRLQQSEEEEEEDEDDDEEPEDAEESADAGDFDSASTSFWWGLGPAMVISTDGIPPALGPAAMLGVALNSEFAVEVDLAGTIALSRFSDPRGEAQTGSLHGHLHLVWSPDVSFPLGPRIGIGAGTAAIWADRSNAAGVDGAGIQFAFEGVLWAGARWRVTPDFQLEARFGASLTEPNLNLFVENATTGETESAAALGRPILHVAIFAVFPS